MRRVYRRVGRLFSHDVIMPSQDLEVVVQKMRNGGQTTPGDSYFSVDLKKHGDLFIVSGISRHIAGGINNG